MGTLERFRLASGREIGLHRFGPEPSTDGRTIVFCHAAPGSGAFDPGPDETDRRGVTILAPDRPGYGHSEPVGDGEWSSVDRAADDIAEILERLGTGRVGAVGWSAGGRVALALAARHPDRVDRVVVAATPAPDEEVPWIPPQQKAGVEALRDQPPARAHAALAEQLKAMVPAEPTSPGALAGLGFDEAADGEALAAAGVRDRLIEMLGEAYRQGALGMAADIAGYTLRPWGFEPDEVRTKTLLLYGGKDRLAGPSHGRWWQQHLPDARLEVFPDVGHLVVIPAWKRTLSHLAPAAAAVR